MTDLEFLKAVQVLADRAGNFDMAREAEKRALQPHVFQLGRDGFAINGLPIRHRAGSKGLAFAWMVLAARQYRLGPVDPAWLFPGGDAPRRAYQAVRCAAQAVERVSPAAGAALRNLVVQGSGLTLLQPVPLRCGMAPELLKVFA